MIRYHIFTIVLVTVFMSIGLILGSYVKNKGIDTLQIQFDPEPEESENYVMFTDTNVYSCTREGNLLDCTLYE